MLVQRTYETPLDVVGHKALQHCSMTYTMCMKLQNEATSASGRVKVTPMRRLPAKPRTSSALLEDAASAPRRTGRARGNGTPTANSRLRSHLLGRGWVRRPLRVLAGAAAQPPSVYRLEIRARIQTHLASQMHPCRPSLHCVPHMGIYTPGHAWRAQIRAHLASQVWARKVPRVIQKI